MDLGTENTEIYGFDADNDLNRPVHVYDLEVDQNQTGPSVDRLASLCVGTLMIPTKETDMSNVVRMSNAKDDKRGPNSFDGVTDTETSRANFSYRLFLIVDVAAFAMIEWLRESLEAHSYGDVVRQAVRAFALRFAESETEVISELTNADDVLDSTQKLKRLNIRIPLQTKERLDLLKDRSGLSYTDIIMVGLEILSNQAKNDEAILAKIGRVSRKGGGLEVIDSHPLPIARKDASMG